MLFCAGTDDQLWGLGGEFAFNHAILITGAVQYYVYSGDQRALQVAQEVADSHLAHSTPENWQAPFLAASFVRYTDEGVKFEFGLEWGLEPDKSAYMGVAFVRLHAVTGRQDYLERAKNIAATLRKLQRDDGSFSLGVPGIVEQSEYAVVLTHHQLRLAEMHAKLYEVTGQEHHKRTAIETANSVTWCQMSDGKIRQGFWYHAVACPLVLSFNEQFCRIMACIPETAPQGEDHLLQYTSDLRRISYQPKHISYEATSAGEEVLTVRSQPQEVLSADRALMRLKRWGYGEEGWRYDEVTGQLRVKHEAPDVRIQF